MKKRQFTTLVSLSDPEGGHQVELHADYFDLQPTPETSEAGITYPIDHTFHVEEPTESVAYYSCWRNAIVTLHTTDGATVALGSRLCPVRAHVYRELQGYALHVMGSVTGVF